MFIYVCVVCLSLVVDLKNVINNASIVLNSLFFIFIYSLLYFNQLKEKKKTFFWLHFLSLDRVFGSVCLV